ncbi:MAG TPA: HPr family phosphocarrier protein [bacterium]|nr:HPr family phosphocarrier protein [bacterium]HSA32848.1 HPr family phosphocarrier protein [bacterium]
MREHTVTLQYRKGIHARAASLFAKEAERFSSKVELEKNGVRINAKSITGILMLKIPFGATFKIIVNGPDEDECLTTLVQLAESRFEEEL